MARARIGIIGAGWWATTAHLPSLATYPRAEIVGIADPDLEKANAAAAQYGVDRVFADHRDLLALRLDGVVIATPHHTHYDLIVDALEAGCDVMVEKPMVVAAEQGRHVVQLASARGRRLHVGYPYAHTPHAIRLRNAISGGAIGTVQFASCLFASSVYDFYCGRTNVATHPAGGPMWGPGTQTYSNPERGGGQMLTQVTHAASLLFLLSGLRPNSLTAYADRFDTRVDVWDAIAFRCADGAAGTIASTGMVPPAHGNIEEYRIFGTAGLATIDPRRGTMTIVDADGAVQSDNEIPPDDRYPMHLTARHLVDCILDGTDPLVPGELGLYTVEFLDAALRSAAAGTPKQIGGA